MQRVSIDDPAWRTTFPHLVAPLSDEWLPGLLLRCDEVNQWESQTTLSILQQLSPSSIDPHNMMERHIYSHPHLIQLENLAQLLAIPTDLVLATTFYFERVQLFPIRNAPERLNPPFKCHLCPECVAESRLLRRSLSLPMISHCPQHQFTLQYTCQCGSPLRLFYRQSRPFTCYSCGVNWADLPRIEASDERVELEHEFLLWYEFFFSKGTLLSSSLMNKLYSKPRSERNTHILFRTSVFTGDSCYEIIILGLIAMELALRNLSPSDLKNYEESFSSGPG